MNKNTAKNKDLQKMVRSTKHYLEMEIDKLKDRQKQLDEYRCVLDMNIELMAKIKELQEENEKLREELRQLTETKTK